MVQRERRGRERGPRAPDEFLNSRYPCAPTRQGQNSTKTHACRAPAASPNSKPWAPSPEHQPPNPEPKICIRRSAPGVGSAAWFLQISPILPSNRLTLEGLGVGLRPGCWIIWKRGRRGLCKAVNIGPVWLHLFFGGGWCGSPIRLFSCWLHHAHTDASRAVLLIQRSGRRA